MGTRADHAEKTAVRALVRRHALLAAWLDLLNRIDNPMRRRAAKLRQEQRPRRDISLIRGPRTRDISGLCTPQRSQFRGSHSASAAGGGTRSAFNVVEAER